MMKQITDDQGALMPASMSALPQKKTPRERLASLSLLVILVLTAGLYALLMLRDDLPLVALVLLALVWALHLYADRWSIQTTPMDVPILGLLILLPINLLISADPSSTLTRIYHLLLSFSLFFAIVRLVQYRKHLPILILALIGLAFGAGLLGLFATEWSSSSVFGFLSPIYARLPRLSAIVSGASINKNTVGGVLAFFPALLLSLLWDENAFKRLVSKYIRVNKHHNRLYKAILFLITILVMAVLVLTQSRGAWLGTMAGVYALLLWKDKRFWAVIPISALFIFLILNNQGVGSFSELMAMLDRGQDASLQGRVDIWVRIISMIRDFPVTGVGLDALNPVYQAYFNPFLFDEPAAALFHAHNTLLTALIEMGIPALILFVALLSAFTAMAKTAWKHARSINRVLIMGMVCGMISHLVFGLMDAFPLGKNLGIVLWIYLGVMAALFVHRDQMVHSQPKPEKKAAPPLNTQLRSYLGGLAAWLILSLLALNLILWNVYVSVVVSILAGVFLGDILVKPPISFKIQQQLRPLSDHQ